MSLFGIAYAIMKAGSSVIVNARNSARNLYNKKHAMNQDGKTYIGYDGVPRIVGSGKKGAYSRNAAGDWVLYDEDHKEVYNFTRTENNSRDRENRKVYGEKGKTIYQAHNSWGELCWKDVETNHSVKTTWVNGSPYYWDVEDMCLLRLTDDEIKKRKKPEYVENIKYEDVDIPRFNALLKEFNEKQREDLSYCFPGQNVSTTIYNTFLGTNSKESNLGFYINYDPFIIASKYYGKYNIYIDKGDEDIVNEYWDKPEKVAESLIRKDWVPLYMRNKR